MQFHKSLCLLWAWGSFIFVGSSCSCSYQQTISQSSGPTSKVFARAVYGPNAESLAHGEKPAVELDVSIEVPAFEYKKVSISKAPVGFPVEVQHAGDHFLISAKISSGSEQENREFAKNLKVERHANELQWRMNATSYFCATSDQDGQKRVEGQCLERVTVTLPLNSKADVFLGKQPLHLSRPMTVAELLLAFDDVSFESDQVSLVEMFLQSNKPEKPCLSGRDLRELVDAMGFDSGRTQILEKLFDSCRQTNAGIAHQDVVSIMKIMSFDKGRESVAEMFFHAQKHADSSVETHELIDMMNTMSFDQGRTFVAQKFLSARKDPKPFLKVREIVAMMETMSFDHSRLELARDASSYVVDPESALNDDQLDEVMSFSNNVLPAMRHLSRNR